MDVPQPIFDRLLACYLEDQGCDLAVRYEAGSRALLGEAFGEVFVWLWETDQDTAVQALATLLQHARETCAEDDPVPLATLLDDLRHALHRTRYTGEQEFLPIREAALAGAPDWYPGDGDPTA